MKPQIRTMQKAVERAVEAGIEQLGYELEEAYGRSIDRFYKDYPFTQSYSRTYSLYAGSDSWDNPLKNKRKRGNKYYIGITVSGENIVENIGENPYEDPVNFVFGRSYESGIHGMTPEGAAAKGLKWRKNPMSPPPIHFMEKDYKRKIATNEHLDELFGRLISRELDKLK